MSFLQKPSREVATQGCLLARSRELVIAHHPPIAPYAADMAAKILDLPLILTEGRQLAVWFRPLG